MKNLREDALAIWRSGVDAVSADRLVERAVNVAGNRLHIGHLQVPLDAIDRVWVAGGGKAAGAMAAGLERALAPVVPSRLALSGFLNVPDNCLRPLAHLQLHPARPAGCNEPTPEAAAGCERMLQAVGQLGPRDLCICLISGGGSALLPAPVPPITLDDKRQVTRALSAAGASIDQLNEVRRALSRIKGGGLARQCRAGWLVGLLISDVLGDRLDVIASGPTVPAVVDPSAPLRVLEQLQLLDKSLPQRVVDYLQARANRQADLMPSLPTRLYNFVVGNNQTAVESSCAEAQRRGYTVLMWPPEEASTTAEQSGRRLADQAMDMLHQSTATCLVWGGEPVVRLAPPEMRGQGGRNQQLVLAALMRVRLLAKGEFPPLVVLSGGTDGEDGPTDAAGALCDRHVDHLARSRRLDAAHHLARCDAYAFFDQAGGLIKTGPTETNVGDLRVAVVVP